MRIISSFAAVALVAAAVLVAPEADAQRRNNNAVPVVVINYERILTETALGRDMATKLQGIRQTIGAEAQTLQPEGQAIEAERQRLATATRNMTAEQVRAHATHGPAVTALNQRIEALQRRGQQLQGDMECSQAFALRDFDQMVTPVVRSVMESRGAGVVLDARNIQLANPDLDITNTVIQQLDQNQATRVATVARHSLAECQGTQQQQAPQTQQ